MNYRNLFLEFMYEYREYFADYIQLVILENSKNDDLINYFAENEEIHVFHSRDIQVFYKKRSFNDVQNTLIELALVNDTPHTYDIESLNGLIDIYSDEALSKKSSQYVFVKPIILDSSMKAVLIVYSNYQAEWMVNDKKLIKLCNALQLALSNELYNDIESNALSKYWLLENNQKYYLSKELAILTKLPTIVTKLDLKGCCLRKIDNKDYLNVSLISYEHNNLPILQSRFELEKLFVNDFTFIYIEKNENETFEGFYNRLIDNFFKIDGQCGKYKMYQVDNHHIVLLYEEVHSKKLIEDLYKDFSLVLIRSGNEIKQKPEFKELIEYLLISPIEPFNYDYYKYFIDKYNIEKIKKVIVNTSKSKIKIIPIFDSLYSKKRGYLIKDTANIKLFDKNAKQKSLLSILKIAEEYKENELYLEIPLDYLFEGNKLSLSVLNKIHKFINDNKERVYIITNYQTNLFKIHAHWPEFNKYVYFYDIPNNLYQSLLSIKNSNGLYINSNEYREFFDSSNLIASEFIKYILHDAKNILINVKKTDIIKYQQENLLLVCE